MDNLAGSQFGQTVSKIHDKFHSEIAFTICTDQFHFGEKGPRKPETVIKDGYEEIEHKFPFGTF